MRTRVDRAGILSAKQQAPQQFAAREASVDQQSGAGAGDERAIPFAAARQYRYRHRHNREHKRKREFAVVTKSLTVVEVISKNANLISKRRIQDWICTANGAACTRNAQQVAFCACVLVDFQAFFHAIEAQAIACRFPVEDDHSAMRGDPDRNSCGPDLIPSARFEGSRDLPHIRP